MKELDLGKESIGKLIAKFSIPCVISMIVAALYNIVDQIFIGWSEAGAYGNAATNGSFGRQMRCNCNFLLNCEVDDVS